MKTIEAKHAFALLGFLFATATGFAQSGPPVITQEPASLTVFAGQNATFTVAATNGPLTYQWQSGPVGSGIFNNLPGGANPAFSINDVTPTDAADFRVVVANVLGTSTSTVATLTVTAELTNTINLLAGYNLIANQLDHGSNTLEEIMPNVPDGSVVYKYDNVGGTWSQSFYSAASGLWTPSGLTLNPGEGAFFQSPTNFTLTLTGMPNAPALPLALQNGVAYLLSRQTNDVGNYTNIVGYAPTNGAQWYQWNPATSAYLVYSNNGSQWLPSEPSAAVGEAVWIASTNPGALGTRPVLTLPNTTIIPGSNLTFTITVSNPGPVAVTGVILTNWLGVGLHVQSMQASQGTLTNIVISGATSGWFNGDQVQLPTRLQTVPWDMAVADLDGDGMLDVVSANSQSGSNSPAFLSVFHNMGQPGGLSAASFAAPLQIPATNCLAVAIADLDGDGLPDVVAYGLSGQLVLLRNLSTPGNIQFAPPVFIPVAGGSHGLAIADLNGDGRPELILVNEWSNTVTVLENLTTGPGLDTNSFGPGIQFAVGQGPSSIVVGDLDGDGWPDLVVSSLQDAGVAVLRNLLTTNSPLTSASFAPAFLLQASTNAQPDGSGVWEVRLGDVNGDGRPDIVAAYTGDNSVPPSGFVAVWPNRSTPGVLTSNSFPQLLKVGNFHAQDVQLADLNGDGALDLVALNFASSGTTVQPFLNNGNAANLTFAPAAQTSFSGNGALRLKLADLDGDGMVDALVNASLSDDLVGLRNTTVNQVVADLGTLAPGQTVTITLNCQAASAGQTMRTTAPSAAGSLNITTTTLTGASVTAGAGGGCITWNPGIEYSTPGDTFHITGGTFSESGGPYYVTLLTQSGDFPIQNLQEFWQLCFGEYGLYGSYDYATLWSCLPAGSTSLFFNGTIPNTAPAGGRAVISMLVLKGDTFLGVLI
jgi:uncharacterized repeat protein (TIGR01451 family)